jgi:hypothetical protein
MPHKVLTLSRKVDECKPLGPGDAGAGGGVQVDPIKPKLKVPRCERLKLQSDDMLSNFAFKFNLRHHTLVEGCEQNMRHALALGRAVQVEPIKHTLKAPGVKLLKLKCDKPLPKFASKFNLRCFNWDVWT